MLNVDEVIRNEINTYSIFITLMSPKVATLKKIVFWWNDYGNEKSTNWINTFECVSYLANNLEKKLVHASQVL